MSTINNIDAKEYVFSRNIKFLETPLNEVKRELLKKKIQLNSAFNNPEYTTEGLYKYVVELEEYIEKETLAKDARESNYKDSMRICNLLIGASIFIFVIFGGFAILTNSLLLGIVALINGIVFGIIIFYKNNMKKNMNII